jgi:ankyrin repeat protein
MKEQSGWKVLFAFIFSFLPTVILAVTVYVAYNRTIMKSLALKFVKQQPLTPDELLRLYDYYGDKLRDKEGNALLHRVVKDICFSGNIGEIDLLLQLLEKGALPNLRNKFGQTPIHTAVIYCNDSEVLETVVSYLIDHNGSVNGKDYAGNTPLFYAVEKKPVLLKTYLRFHPEIAETNCYSWSPLCKTAFLCLEEQFEILMENGASLKNSCGKISVKDLLNIKRSGKIPDNLKHLLFYPKVNCKNLKYVKFDFERNVNEALNCSLAADNLREFRFLVEGNLTNFNTVSLAEDCCKFCSRSILNYLFSSGNKLNRTLENGETLLHICAKNGCKNCLDIFKKYNFDFNAKDKRGFTPYCAAIENNQLETAEKLLDMGANPKASCVKTAKELRELKEFLGVF